MKRVLFSVVGAVWAAVAFATAGDSEANAMAIAPNAREQTKSVTLVDEYDPWSAGTTGQGVCWLKMTLSRGQSYSVWLTDAKPKSPSGYVRIESVDTSFESMQFINAYFSTLTLGGQERWIMYADSWWWDPEFPEFSDPTSAVFYVKVSGEIGDSAVIHYQQGVATPEGLEDSPVLLTMGTTKAQRAAKMTDLHKTVDHDCRFFFKTSMVAGRKYLYATEGGTGAYPLGIMTQGVGREYECDDWKTAYNESVAFVPPVNGNYTIVVTGAVTTADRVFSLKYQVLPERKIAAHPKTALTVGTSVKCEPGRINDPVSGFYDGIIDQNLYSFAATKGVRYVASTKGAETSGARILIRIYDSNGNVLVENDGSGNGDHDALAAFVASATTTYYVGVCQKLADDDLDKLVPCEVEFLVDTVTAKEGDPDAWDPADDAYVGATVLSPKFMARPSDNLTQIDPDGHGPHELSATDWYDVYAVRARKGVTYAFLTTLVESTNATTFKAEVFTVSTTGKETPVATKGAGIEWYNYPDPLNFTATANTTYYLRLSTKEGIGLRHGAYKLHCGAYEVGTSLGILKVNTKGAAGTWTLNSESSPVYADGDEIFVPAGAVKVNFKSVSGFNLMATSVSDSVKVGETTTVTGVYSDTFDPKDNTAAGATALTVSATPNRAMRTLFAEDPEDNFRFTANANSIYKFRLEKPVGDCLLTVTNAERGTVVAATAEEITNLKLPASTKPYYVVVGHSGSGVDGSYALFSVSYAPTVITPGTSAGTKTAKIVEGEAYFQATLTAGRKYMFGYADAELVSIEGGAFEKLSGGPFASQNGFDFYPAETATYRFRFAGQDNAQMTFRHQVAATRKASAHASVQLTLASGTVAAEAAPGWVNAPGSAYADNIVDDCLYKINLVKGKTYRFSTEGATGSIVLYVYNSSDAVIAQTRTTGEEGFDVCTLLPVTAAGMYYVGIAQDFDEKHASVLPVADMKVRFTVEEVDQTDEAVALDVLPNVWTDLDQDGFSAERWTRTYRIAARKGVTYRLTTETELTTPYALAMRAFKRSGTTETALKSTVWSGVADEKGVYELKADENAEYFIELSVADTATQTGKGQTYPSFTLRHTAVAADGSALGVLKVTAKGAMGTWTVNAESAPKYTSGSSILIAGKVTVKFGAVSGFNLRAVSETVEMKEWKAEGDEVVVQAVYSDTSDPKDDKPAGATSWTLSNKWTGHERTLWEEDPEDNFTFAGNDGYYYDFALTNVAGEVEFAITNATPTAACPNGVFFVGKAVSKIVLPKLATKYFLTVFHADAEGGDCSYRIEGRYANVGTIKFASTAVSVNENAGTVKLTVNRSAKDGRVRVKYGTVAGSAKPGEDYLAQNGILEWVDGDNKAKDIVIKLVPDLKPTFEGTNKTFSVRLEPIPEYDRAADEYEACFPVDAKKGVTLNEATVTLKEVSKAVPGTIQVADCETPKKPVFDVFAGEELSFRLERTAGVDGIVAVRVETVKGTANKSGETDFEPIVVTNRWGDGVSGMFSDPIVVRTKQMMSDYTQKKTFTLKLTVLKTNTAKDKSGQLIDPTVYANPTIAASTITVNILNDKYVMTTADWSKVLDKAAGVTAVREGKANSWFREIDGSAYSTVTRTFKGPMRVSWGISADEGGSFCGPVAYANVLYIPSGKSETVVMRSDAPYDEFPLTVAEAESPTDDKAAVAAGETEFCFYSDAAAWEDDAIVRVYVLKKGETAKSATTNRTLALGDPETELFPDEEGRFVSNLVANATYTWRVDSCFVDDDGEPLVTLPGKPWTLNTLSEEAPAMRVVRVVDGEEEEVLDDAIFLLWGVPVEFRLYGNAEVPPTTLTKISGQYPGGLSNPTLVKPDAKDGATWYWRLFGTPNKASVKDGPVSVLLQLKGTSPYVSHSLCFWTGDEPTAEAVFPADKADIPSMGDVVLDCGLSPEWDTYRLFIAPAADKAKLGKDETEIVPDEPYPVEAGKQYVWQVFTCNEGGTITNKSAQFTFTVASEDAKSTEVKGKDAWGDEYDPEFGELWLKQRLYAEFEIADPEAKKVAVVSGSGKLPDGLKLEQDKSSKQWYVRGTPTKAGEFEVLLQATYVRLETNATGRVTTVDVPAATAQITFIVEEVEAVPDITFTLTGPGAFTYTAEGHLDPMLDNPFTRTEYVAAGSKSLVLKDITRLVDWTFVQLPKETAEAPTADKAVVQPGPTELRFSGSTSGSYCGVGPVVEHRVYILENGAKGLNDKGQSVALKLGDPATEIEPPYNTNLVANTKYTWRVDSYFADGTVTNASSVFTLSTVTASAAGLVTPVCGSDAYRQPVEEGSQVRLVVGVKTKLTLGDAEGATLSTTDTFAKVSGNLPTGLSIVKTAVKEGTRTVGNVNTIEGVPTKAGVFQAVLQRTCGKEKGSTVTLDFVVDPIDYAVGNFCGILDEDGSALTNGYPRLGSLTLTTTSAGQITAKVKVAGTDYSFTGKGFDAQEASTSESFDRQLVANLELVKKIGTTTYTNYLELVVADGSLTNLAVLGEVAGTARLSMAVPSADNKTVQEATYLGRFYRDNTKSADYLKAFEKFAGYYTVALPVVNPESGKPQGSGYLTLTLDAKGKSKVAGKLADKAMTAVSCSFVPALLGDVTDPEHCELIVPVFQTAKPYVFGGELRLVMADIDDEPMPVVDSSYELRWCNDDAAQTYFGESGWDYALSPCGGWYNTVYSLQTYYLSSRFSVDAGKSDDLPTELLKPGYEFVASAMPTGEPLDLVDNKFNVDKQVLVKGVDGLYDFNSCTNVANVSVTFTRATGLINGSFDVWMQNPSVSGASAQQKLSGFKYNGVYLFVRDLSPYLADDVWAPGFFLTPQFKVGNRSVMLSRPFNIKAEDQGDLDWWAEDWGELPPIRGE